MGMIFRNYDGLNPAFTVENQMIETLARHRSITGGQARKLAIKMLEKVGITPAEQRLRQYPHQLSGGLRQRVMIAMTLLCEPELIIADEPTTALDVTIRAQILDLCEVQDDFDVGLIFITHDLGSCKQLIGWQLCMLAKLLRKMRIRNFDKPTPIHKGLLRCIPVPGKIKRGEPLAPSDIVPSLLGEMKSCRFAGRWDDSVPLDLSGKDQRLNHFLRKTDHLKWWVTKGILLGFAVTVFTKIRFEGFAR